MKKQTEELKNAPFMPVLCGLAVSVVVTFVLLILFAVLLSIRDVPQPAVTPIALLAAGAGALAGGYCTTKIKKSKGLFYGALTSLLFFVILSIASAFLDHQTLSWLLFARLIVVLLCGSLGGIAGVNTKKKRKYK